MAVMGIIRARDDTKYPIGHEYRNGTKTKNGYKVLYLHRNCSEDIWKFTLRNLN